MLAALLQAAAIPAASLGLHQHGILRPCIPTTRDNASDTVEAAGALKDTAEPYVRVPALGAQHVLPLRAATQYEAWFSYFPSDRDRQALITVVSERSKALRRLRWSGHAHAGRAAAPGSVRGGAEREAAQARPHL